MRIRTVAVRPRGSRIVLRGSPIPSDVSWRASPDAIDAAFGAGGAGTVAFHLDGFATLDGDNDSIDVFTPSVNGSAVFSGTWDLVGGVARRRRG